MAEAKGYDPLEVLVRGRCHEFLIPQKRINDGDDVSFWLSSIAYRDIMKFLLQLNLSMFPQKSSDPDVPIQHWTLSAENVKFSPTVLKLKELMVKLEKTIEEAPPDTGPRRFGNISFRKWYQIVETRADQLLKEHLPQQVQNYPTVADVVTPLDELKKYFIGSFGSAQRLDYGSGHELSFLAFIGCIWKLGGFENTTPGAEERGIVLGIIEPYLHLIRALILTYTLEPAGSHGVWGLDDHSFVPFIFGSAQLSPAIDPSFSNIPLEGSAPNAPKPGDVANRSAVERERNRNMYFSAIGFIYDVKKGPFWEHSPILYDVSGVQAGWAKINKGMIKMYNAEVLSKFPVVQHFPFGSLFAWEREPGATAIASTIHTKSQPRQQNSLPSRSAVLPPTTSMPSRPGPPMEGTNAPWASAGSAVPTVTTRLPAVPDGRAGPLGGMPPPGPTGLPMTRAPWATGAPRAPQPAPSSRGTAAPWARNVPSAARPPPGIQETKEKNEGEETHKRETT